MSSRLAVKINDNSAIILLRSLIFIELGLLVLYLSNIYIELPYPIEEFIDLDGEANFPVWFTSVQLFTLGLLFIFSQNWPCIKHIEDPKFYIILGICFVALSIDETAVVHEKVTSTLKQISWIPRFKGDHGIWIPLYILIAITLIIVGHAAIKSTFKTYKKQVKVFILGLFIILFGGIGLEILGYLYLRVDGMQLLYKYATGFEEFFEMLGVSTLLYSTILCAIQDEI